MKNIEEDFAAYFEDRIQITKDELTKYVYYWLGSDWGNVAKFYNIRRFLISNFLTITPSGHFQINWKSLPKEKQK